MPSSLRRLVDYNYFEEESVVKITFYRMRSIVLWRSRFANITILNWFFFPKIDKIIKSLL